MRETCGETRIVSVASVYSSNARAPLPEDEPEPEVHVVSGMTWSYGFYMQIGCVGAVAGLLSSTVKASKLTVAFLGSGGLLVILAAGFFISSFYEKLDVYPKIQDIGTGSFITLIGGICVLLTASYILGMCAASNARVLQ